MSKLPTVIDAERLRQNLECSFGTLRQKMLISAREQQLYYGMAFGTLSALYLAELISKTEVEARAGALAAELAPTGKEPITRATIETEELKLDLERMRKARAQWRAILDAWDQLAEAEYQARTAEFGQRLQVAEEAYRIACEDMAESVEALMRAAEE